MKVCHLTTVHDSTDIRVFHKECKTLAANNFEVTLIAPCKEDKYVEGVRILALKTSFSSRALRFLFAPLNCLAKAARVRADVYHFHDPELIFIGFVLRLLGNKVIYDVHEDYSMSILTKYYIPVKFRKLISRLFQFVEKAISSSFSYIVVATDRIGENFEKNNVVPIHNYPVMKNVSYETCLDGPLGPKEVFTVIYPGVLSQNRGIDNLLEAMDILVKKGITDIRLILIGNSVPGTYVDELKKKDICAYVDFFDFLPHKDVMRMLSLADVGIECSLPEPNYLYSESNKIYEYMTASLPVICSNLPRLTEIVEGSECGICIDPLDVQAIADAIEKMKNDRGLCTRLGKNGAVAVKSKYNWEAESKGLLDIYRSLSV